MAHQLAHKNSQRQVVFFIENFIKYTPVSKYLQKFPVRFGRDSPQNSTSPTVQSGPVRANRFSACQRKLRTAKNIAILTTIIRSTPFLMKAQLTIAIAGVTRIQQYFINGDGRYPIITSMLR